MCRDCGHFQIEDSLLSCFHGKEKLKVAGEVILEVRLASCRLHAHIRELLSWPECKHLDLIMHSLAYENSVALLH